MKRGGQAQILSLDFDAAEAELAQADRTAPDDVFDREWRRNVFATAVAALRAECEQTGKSACFAVFERYDLCDDDERPTYADVGKALGLPATTVTNHLSFARRTRRRQLTSVRSWCSPPLRWPSVVQLGEPMLQLAAPGRSIFVSLPSLTFLSVRPVLRESVNGPLVSGLMRSPASRIAG